MRSLAQAGVELCLANPGTSEMHLVKALDAAPAMRSVLTLHEGVASGAADGWGRMTGRAASTLLHLGPGLANALSNLHNARRSATPVVNIVGDHATYHLANDPPLHSDLPALARASSAWVETVATAEAMAGAGARAVAASLGPPGAIATLIVPADAAWGVVEDARGEAALRAAARAPAVYAGTAPSDATIDGVAQVLRSGEPAVILLGGRAVSPANAERAGRVAAATGARLCSAPFSAIAPRGAGSVATERLPYFPEMVLQLLAGVRHLILVDAPAPVAFFAYPGLPGRLVPEGCSVHVLATGSDDVVAALDALVVACGAEGGAAPRVARAVPPVASGAITPATFAQTLAATLPSGAIVCDEAITNRFPSLAATAGAAPHDWLDLTGGSLGLGMPMALGAAMACPGRRVVNLQADGSAMYTPQALWSLAREGVDVTTIILANRRYRILEYELMRLQLTDAARARSLTDLSTPPIDFVQLAGSLGVPAVQVTTAEGLGEALQRSYATPGPQVIEAMIVE
ncbi:MAG: acetolactate synthase large subunit [Gemmatimonadaceae bacterium]|nr:acetolactate synthase large subunit [Gemmatimonadaceae bacterium]